MDPLEQTSEKLESKWRKIFTRGIIRNNKYRPRNVFYIFNKYQ